MNDYSKLETEELLACLHIHLFHPNQTICPLFHNLPLNQPYKMHAEDQVRLGRDGQTCVFVLNDTSVSRKQLSIQAYRKAGSPFLSFMIQNMSQKVKLMVGGSELRYLERAELDDKVLCRFGRYELLIWQEPGDSENKFEVLFEICNTPPSQELGIDVPCKPPVMDTGVPWRSFENGAPASQEPLESDETVVLV
ncbi:TRAF-interacting protein with FHA domain-containing protein A-like [Sinocyclocheilus rhinocerous]|uniref:TRAF-interacting protein with FHA domain-containing protein A n=1 Tax=Sinocyclocheilus rhinocerous TaxID=307959 RepID=A0A673LH85_9TELE|nr:PREDICTED: TRAF-interacting protein with FHA domain-containing protein A-like [Sinocyclocheilus rhinocerous]